MRNLGGHGGAAGQSHEGAKACPGLLSEGLEPAFCLKNVQGATRWRRRRRISVLEHRVRTGYGDVAIQEVERLRLWIASFTLAMTIAVRPK